MSVIEAPRPYPSDAAAASAAAPLRRVAPRPAPEEQPRHLHVVAPAERVRPRLTPATGVLLTAALFVTLFAIAIAHTLLVGGQIRLDGLDGQLTVEQARYQKLRTEVAEMEAPARVVAAAQGLGMVAPDDLVYLQPRTVEHSTRKAEPAPAGDATTETDWSLMKPLLEAPAP